MKTNDQVGRNEPCPCGSGKKFKVCCGGRQDIVQEARRSPWLMGGLAVAGLAVVATAALQLGGSGSSAADRSSTLPVTPQPLGSSSPAPQPPGPAPDGKVWSAEHGHYHDAAGSAPAAAPNAPRVPQKMTTGSGQVIDMTPIPAPKGVNPLQPGSPPAHTPQPDGPVPEGKVWSPEHGHWHDATPPGAPPPK